MTCFDKQSSKVSGALFLPDKPLGFFECIFWDFFRLVVLFLIRSLGLERWASIFSMRRLAMLWTIVVILIVLWLLGLAANVAGGVIHLLLVLALVIIVVNALQGRRTV